MVFAIQKFILQICKTVLLKVTIRISENEGGSKAVWNFSENSSVLEGVGVPYICNIIFGLKMAPPPFGWLSKIHPRPFQTVLITN